MKNLLRFSIFANVVCSGLIFWLVRGKLADAGRGPAVVPVQITNAPAEIQATQASVPEPSLAAVPKPFRWSELESTDYRTYLANLRNIGCPEQTIRDILTADVDSVFAPRREQAERTSANSLAAQAEIERLRGEESAFLAALLGDTPPTQKSAPKDPPWLRARNIRPAVPLVFGNIDPSTLNLNSAQIAVIDQVRQQFREEVGAQDTNDPTYIQRWNKAQRDADDRLRGLLGSKVYLQYQLQAANKK